MNGFYYKRSISPLGMMTLQSDGEYFTGVSFGGCEREQEDKTATPVLERTARRLDIYFGSSIPDFIPPVLTLKPDC